MKITPEMIIGGLSGAVGGYYNPAGTAENFTNLLRQREAMKVQRENLATQRQYQIQDQQAQWKHEGQSARDELKYRALAAMPGIEADLSKTFDPVTAHKHAVSMVNEIFQAVGLEPLTDAPPTGAGPGAVGSRLGQNSLVPPTGSGSELPPIPTLESTMPTNDSTPLPAALNMLARVQELPIAGGMGRRFADRQEFRDLNGFALPPMTSTTPPPSELVPYGTTINDVPVAPTGQQTMVEPKLQGLPMPGAGAEQGMPVIENPNQLTMYPEDVQKLTVKKNAAQSFLAEKQSAQQKRIAELKPYGYNPEHLADILKKDNLDNDSILKELKDKGLDGDTIDKFEIASKDKFRTETSAENWRQKNYDQRDRYNAIVQANGKPISPTTKYEGNKEAKGKIGTSEANLGQIKPNVKYAIAPSDYYTQKDAYAEIHRQIDGGFIDAKTEAPAYFKAAHIRFYGSPDGQKPTADSPYMAMMKNIDAEKARQKKDMERVSGKKKDADILDKMKAKYAKPK